MAIGSGQSLVVVNFAPGDQATAAEFRRRYGIDETVELVGPYVGRLSDEGETVRLERPVAAGDPLAALTLVDRVTYASEPPWPAAASSGGSSLTRAGAGALGDLADSWRPLPPTPGRHAFADPGDLNLEGVVDPEDVAALVQALKNPAAYWAQYGMPPALGGDADGDLDFDDVDDLLRLILANRFEL